MERYEIFSTTADVGLRVRGRDCAELCHHSLLAFNTLLFGVEKNVAAAPAGHPHVFEYRGDSCENLLVNLLAEMVAIVNDKKQMAGDWSVISGTEKRLRLEFQLTAWPVAPLLEIKSVTYHNLRIRRDKGVRQAEIILDV